MKDKGSSTIFVAGVMVLTIVASPLALGGKQAVTQIDCRPCLLHNGVDFGGFVLMSMDRKEELILICVVGGGFQV